MFCEILWRMSQCTNEQLGLDPTARRIYPGGPLYQVMAEEMKDHASDIDFDSVTPSDLDELAPGQSIVYTYMRRMFRRSLPDDAPRYVLDVPYGNETRQYLVGKPLFTTKEVIGRGTLGADYPGVEPEGQILQELNDVDVPHIPTAVCHGDLPGQKTVSPEIWDWAETLVNKDPNVALAVRKDVDDKLTTQRPSRAGPKTKPLQGQRRQQSKSKLRTQLQLEQLTDTGTTSTHPQLSTPSKTPLRKHQHARLVVKEIALPLRDFKYSRTLLTVIVDCLEAHYVAVNEKTSRLHRDISDSNIMMIPKLEIMGGVKMIVLRGLLCDWEMSKRINTDVRAPRQPVKSGTWQFKSVTLLNSLDKAVDISDELESFFHVIVYYAVRYLDSNLDAKGVADFIDSYFDTFQYLNGTWRCGYHKRDVVLPGILRASDLKTSVQFGQPLDDVIRTSLRWFQGNYVVQEYTAYLEEQQRASPPSPTPPSSAPSALLHPDNETNDVEPFLEFSAVFLKLNQNWKRPRADSTDSDTSTTSVGHGDSRYGAPQAFPTPTQEQYDLAAKVKTHDDFMKLLYDARRSKRYNRRDPTGDRYPKDKNSAMGEDGGKDDEDGDEDVDVDVDVDVDEDEDDNAHEEDSGDDRDGGAEEDEESEDEDYMDEDYED
ncbi:hypothetical protein GY45DRAFT_1375358 [Cubamyces sp. BRFM 1775]|nr:hypothetical protein GY45DRAFT_1375358 [Cubamyces sp. BRFM 1775]